MADCWEGLLQLLYGSDNIDGDNPQYNGTASPLSLPMKLNVTEPGKKPDYGFRRWVMSSMVPKRNWMPFPHPLALYTPLRPPVPTPIPAPAATPSSAPPAVRTPC